MLDQKPAALLALAAMLVSCSLSPVDSHLEDFGPPPTNAEAAIKAYYEKVLTDPSSAVFSAFTEPKRSWIGWNSSGPSQGYVVCVTYTAKAIDGSVVANKDALLLRANMVGLRIPGAVWFNTRLC